MYVVRTCYIGTLTVTMYVCMKYTTCLAEEGLIASSGEEDLASFSVEEGPLEL